MHMHACTHEGRMFAELDERYSIMSEIPTDSQASHVTYLHEGKNQEHTTHNTHHITCGIHTFFLSLNYIRVE